MEVRRGEDRWSRLGGLYKAGVVAELSRSDPHSRVPRIASHCRVLHQLVLACCPKAAVSTWRGRRAGRDGSCKVRGAGAV